MIEVAGASGEDGLEKESELGIADRRREPPQKVRIRTSCGDITAEVYPRRAPVTVEAFLACVDAGAYDGSAFVRVVRTDNDNTDPRIEVLQLSASGAPESERATPHEPTLVTGLRHLDGTLSLGRYEPGSARPGYMFICIGPQPALDHGGMRNPDGLGFAAFGQVIEGMDVARAIHAGETRADADHPGWEGQVLAEPVAIHSVRRVQEEA